jgi:hypothetical protein
VHGAGAAMRLRRYHALGQPPEGWGAAGCGRPGHGRAVGLGRGGPVAPELL